MDLADARHDQAVSLLTGIDRTVKLVVYREKILPRGSAPPEPSASLSSKVQRLPQITQPVITWNQTSTGVGGASLTLSQQQPPLSPASLSPTGVTPVIGGMGGGDKLRATSPGFSAAVPTSYTHLGRTATSPGPVSPSLNNSMTVSITDSPKVLATSPPATLASDWSTPTSTVQPPRFVYPHFNAHHALSPSQAATTTASPSVVTTTTTTSVGQNFSFTPNQYPRTTENKETISSPQFPGQTMNISQSSALYSATLTNSVSAQLDTNVSRVPAPREQIKRLEFNHVQPSVMTVSSAAVTSPLSPASDFSPQPYPVEVCFIYQKFVFVIVYRSNALHLFKKLYFS